MNYLDLLHNHIDITEVPFSDRGSRVLVHGYPDKSRLFIKLAERLTFLDGNEEAYLSRPPFIQDLAFIDAKGMELDFVANCSPHLLSFHTGIGNFEMVFQDGQTLAFGVPDGVACGIRYKVLPQYGYKSPDGGKIVSIRNSSYNTTGKIIKNRIQPAGSGYKVELVIDKGDENTIAIQVHSAEMGQKPARRFSELRAESEKRWRQWFEGVPEVSAEYARTYAYAWWIMANNLVNPQGRIGFEAMMPSKIGYIGLWAWDSAMHAIAYRHRDGELARNQIRAILANQLEDGMLPDAVYDEGVVSTIDHPFPGMVTKPPIFAWAALKIHEIDPQVKFLREIYPNMVKLNNWWLKKNDDDHDGIVQYNHPYSSGLDDSPLWDEGMPVESPDINTYLCIQMKAMAKIAWVIGRNVEAVKWYRMARQMALRMVDHFWDKEAGLFWAQKDHQPIKVITPFNLFPLFSGFLPDEIHNHILSYLEDQDIFGGQYVIPTVARNDPKFDPQTMWRGPVWANINYFFIEALRTYGERDLANRIRKKTLDMINAQNGIYEFYDPNTGIPPQRAVKAFGWTAAVFIDLAIQESNDRKKAEKMR